MVKIYLDGAYLENIGKYNVEGYTTNPMLMKESGITNYIEFAKEFLKRVPDKPISFEVLNRDNIKEEVQFLSSLGDNVFVKIPIDGLQGLPYISEMVNNGHKINVTGVFTLEQVMEVVKCAPSHTQMIISIFAGRVADTGIDPIPLMKSAVGLTIDKPNIEILWASPREVLNIYQAEDCNCHIITALPAIIDKYEKLKGKDLFGYSMETADQFYLDAKSLVWGTSIS